MKNYRYYVQVEMNSPIELWFCKEFFSETYADELLSNCYHLLIIEHDKEMNCDFPVYSKYYSQLYQDNKFHKVKQKKK